MPHRQAEGMEKRGLIRYGWTPPAGSPVTIEPGSPWQGARKSAGSKTDAECEAALDDDAARRLAEDIEKRLRN